MKDLIVGIFSKVEDPRVQNRCRHKLVDILFIAFCTLLSNGEDFEDMVEFGHQRETWLRGFLELPGGIPSHDTFNRVFQVIDTGQLTACLLEDGEGLVESVRGGLISFDGKKIKGASPDTKGNSGLFILSAWLCSKRLCIGQKKVGDKSNEITAIPELIDEMELGGSVVSIDAIGCQTEIAEKIVDKSADYILALKKNQKNLYESVSDDFIWNDAVPMNETWEYDHGRYEVRQCRVVRAKDVLAPDVYKGWKGLQTFVRVDSERTGKGLTKSNTRYYISSSMDDAAFYNAAVRGHWGIENQLHWHLDVTFREDACKSRSGNAPQNLNTLRKMALQRITVMENKISLKKRRFRASLNTSYLEQILRI